MSVLIKGMEMPKQCSWCKFIDYFEGNPRGYRCLIDKRPCALNENNRRRDCPLIEIPPHGRLIDADAVQEEWQQLNFDRKISDGTLAYWNYQLSKAPTVIEAEGGNEDE